MRGLIESAALWFALLTSSGSSPTAAVPVIGSMPNADFVPAVTTSKRSEAAPSVQAPAPAEPTVAHASPGLQQAIHRNVGFGMLHLPRGFQTERCDLVIHFHGADTTVEPQFDAVLPEAALLLVNAGVQSGPYENRYSDAAALDRTLVATQKALDDMLGGRSCRMGRVALSAWSAGFGAVIRILAHKRNADRVDAVLLGDGMHAGYIDKRAHTVDPRGMKPFLLFASAASEGDKLMSVTHSSISTYGYASTTETAAFLIQNMDLKAREGNAAGPGTMVMSYRADRRGLHIKGYEGRDAAAHCEHLYHAGETLFADLRERWTTP